MSARPGSRTRPPAGPPAPQPRARITRGWLCRISLWLTDSSPEPPALPPPHRANPPPSGEPRAAQPPGHIRFGMRTSCGTVRPQPRWESGHPCPHAAPPVPAPRYPFCSLLSACPGEGTSPGDRAMGAMGWTGAERCGGVVTTTLWTRCLSPRAQPSRPKAWTSKAMPQHLGCREERNGGARWGADPTGSLYWVWLGDATLRASRQPLLLLGGMARGCQPGSCSQVWATRPPRTVPGQEAGAVPTATLLRWFWDWGPAAPGHWW